jgi:integrase
VVPLNKKLADILTPKRKKNGFCAFPERASGVATRSLYDIVLKRHRRLVAALELKESTPRITRSSFASNLVLKGVSVYKVSKWLGHASVKTTEKHYAHLAPKNDEDINRI